MHREVMLILRLEVNDESEPLVEATSSGVAGEYGQPDRSPLPHETFHDGGADAAPLDFG